MVIFELGRVSCNGLGSQACIYSRCLGQELVNLVEIDH